jgi:hypothetical protein
MVKIVKDFRRGWFVPGLDPQPMPGKYLPRRLARRFAPEPIADGLAQGDDHRIRDAGVIDAR